jgi:quinol monooxygenase YgiN
MYRCRRIALRDIRLLAILVCVFASQAACAQTQASDGPIVIVVRFYPTPGREEELQAYFLKAVEFVRKAEPNTVYRLHRLDKDPVVFLWYEVYESQAARDNHNKVVLPAFRKEYGPTPDGIFARPAEIELYRDISR